VISGVAVVLLAAIAVHVWTSREEISYLHTLSLSVLIATLVCQFLVQLLVTEGLLVPLRAHIDQLGFWEFFLVRMGGAFVGSVVPVAGGLAVRLTYLRRRGLTYLDFTWATILSNVLALTAAAALCVLATAVLWAIAGTPPALIIWLTAGVLAVSAAAQLIFQWLPRLAGHHWFRRWPWVEDVSSYRASGQTMAQVFVVSLVRHVLNFITFGLLYAAVSRLPRAFLVGGLIYTLTTPLRIVNITPGNLGVNEWVVAIVGQGVAVDVTTGLIVALLFRAIALVTQIAGVLIGWAWLQGETQKF
jgi:uncharacterized membrane protein YbhN (UPF0104 family)